MPTMTMISFPHRELSNSYSWAYTDPDDGPLHYGRHSCCYLLVLLIVDLPLDT